MRTWMWLGMLIASVAGICPFVMQAQILSDPCCGNCQLSTVHCQCLRTRPVVQNHVREEKVTTYRDVVETRYRDECIVEHTPVTTYEDRVETVWVPQQVTKKVARTVMVPQTKARSVPYQVMHRVPQTATRLVPYQTVHHVTEAVPMSFVAPPPIVSYPAPVISHAWIAPTMAAPVPAASPVRQAESVVPHRAPPLAPAAKRPTGEWQTIQPRSASNTRYGGYESDYERPVPNPTDNEPAVRRAAWRGNVPGAASAWNYSDRSVYR